MADKPSFNGEYVKFSDASNERFARITVDPFERGRRHLAHVLPGVADGGKRQPAPRRLHVAHQAHERVATRGQALAQFAADQAGGTGQQDAQAERSCRKR